MAKEFYLDEILLIYLTITSSILLFSSLVICCLLNRLKTKVIYIQWGLDVLRKLERNKQRSKYHQRPSANIPSPLYNYIELPQEPESPPPSLPVRFNSQTEIIPKGFFDEPEVTEDNEISPSAPEIEVSTEDTSSDEAEPDNKEENPLPLESVRELEAATEVLINRVAKIEAQLKRK